MNDKKSILEELYTDSGAFDTKRVVEILKPYINIRRGGNEIIFTNEGHDLKNGDKMLAYGLMKKLLKNEGLIEDESVSGGEMRKYTELPKGTIDPTMQKLKNDGLLVGKGSNYEIPARRVEAVIERFEKYRS